MSVSLQTKETCCDKVQPGRYPKTMVATGDFVDWGTKCYQLQLELSYKNNEIEILKKKLKKTFRELYPGGDNTKTSAVERLRNKQLATEKKLSFAKQQIQHEKKRCNDLSVQLTQIKKRYEKLRKPKLNNDKSVQTVPDNSKATQVPNNTTRKYRTVTTQYCTDFTRNEEYKDLISTKTPNDEKALKAETSSVQFASAVTIKDNLNENSERKPLEMCLVQEFNKGEVKTMVQANKSFKVTEQPITISRESYDKLKQDNFSFESQFPITGVNTPDSLQSDSGISSIRLSSDSPQHMPFNSPNMCKPSYSQIFNQRGNSGVETPRTYERSLPFYLSSDERPIPTASTNGRVGLKSNLEPQTENSHSFFREMQRRTVVNNSLSAMTPYHLLRREQDKKDSLQTSNSLIYVHTSEIKFPGR